MTIVRPAQVLYLDFDGVLHPEAVYRHPKRGIYVDQLQAPGGTLFQWADQLVQALAPYPAASIVLSTSWVRTLGYSRTRQRLPAELRRRVIGATYHSAHAAGGMGLSTRGSVAHSLRGVEVLDDVRRRQPGAWIAIDDTDEGWTAESRAHLVLCDPTWGLKGSEARSSLREFLHRHFATCG